MPSLPKNQVQKGYLEATGNAAEGGTQAVDVELKYKDGWTAAQKAEADAKVKALTESNTVKTPATRRGNILLFEIGTADVLEIPCDFVDFHNKEIPMYNESCLASTFFKEWKEVIKQILEHNKCAGYKIPLFLGGNDEISNLELSDMEVYWFICSSAKNKK